jgi:hypothetical protein
VACSSIDNGGVAATSYDKIISRKRKRISKNKDDKARIMVLHFINVLLQGNLNSIEYHSQGTKKSAFFKFMETYGFKTSRSFSYKNQDAIWTEMKWFTYDYIKREFDVVDPQLIVFHALKYRDDRDFCCRKFGPFLDFSIKDQPDELVMKE